MYQNIQLRCRLFIFCLPLSLFCAAQKRPPFFASFGFGPAGTYFATTYVEQPFPSRYPRLFYNKNFIGRTFYIGVGKELKRHYSLQLRYSNQQFVKKLDIRDTLANNFEFIYYGRIRHVNHLFEFFANKDLITKTRLKLDAGLGLYYVRPVQGELAIFRNDVVFRERDFFVGRLEELGGLAEIAFEYKFQPKVSIGLKGQFYYRISAPEPESITLVPYVRILFVK